MRPLPIALLAAGLALAGCDRGPAELDIVELAPAQSPMLPPPEMVGPTSLALEVLVRSGPLAAALNRGADVDLLVFACAAPDGPGETVPLYLGGEAITGLAGSQLSDDPDTLVQLNAAVPRTALGDEPACARLVGRPGLMAPGIVSRPVPLPAG